MKQTIKIVMYDRNKKNNLNKQNIFQTNDYFFLYETNKPKMKSNI